MSELRPDHRPLPLELLDVCPECHASVLIPMNHVVLDLREVPPGTGGAMAIIRLAHLLMASSPVPGATLFGLHRHQPPEDLDRRPTETIGHAWRRSRLGSKARQGLDRLLSAYPDAEVVHLEHQSFAGGRRTRRQGPWLNVTLALTAGENVYEPVDFSIWQETGNVYKVFDGAVEDDPFLEVTDLTTRPAEAP